MMILQALVSIVLLFLCQAALAAPTITGVNGVSTIVITGNDFGINASPAPIFYDDFDSNDIGRQNTDTIHDKNASAYGAWNSCTFDAVPTYTNLNQRENSVLSSYSHMICNDSNNNHAILETKFSAVHEGTLLISYWERVQNTGLNWEVDGGNIKDVRILRDTCLSNDSEAVFAIGWGNVRTPLSVNSFMNVWPDTTQTGSQWPGKGTSNLPFPTLTDGTWRHFIIFRKAGTSETEDGSEWIFANDVELINTSAMYNYHAELSPDWTNLRLSYYCANYPSSDIYFQYDDVFVDDTWQSVWIGDASTWAACTHREIQPATAWAADSITVTANQGSFATLEGTYVYVVDSDGNVNTNGFLYTGNPNAAQAETSMATYSTIGASGSYSSTGAGVVKP